MKAHSQSKSEHAHAESLRRLTTRGCYDACTLNHCSTCVLGEYSSCTSATEATDAPTASVLITYGGLCGASESGLGFALRESPSMWAKLMCAIVATHILRWLLRKAHLLIVSRPACKVGTDEGKS